MLRLRTVLLAVAAAALVAFAAAQDDTFTLQILYDSDNESTFQDPQHPEGEDPRLRVGGRGAAHALVSDGVPEIEIGTDGASVEENAGKIARSAWAEVGGERIGRIGRAPADFFNVIEDPATTMPGVDFYGGRDSADNQP